MRHSAPLTPAAPSRRTVKGFVKHACLLFYFCVPIWERALSGGVRRSLEEIVGLGAAR